MNDEIKSVFDLLAKTPNLFPMIYKQGAVTAGNVIDYISFFNSDSKIIFESFMQILNKQEQEYLRDKIIPNLINYYIYEKGLNTKSEHALLWQSTLNVNILSFIKEKSNNNYFWEQYVYKNYPLDTLDVLNQENILIINTKENSLTDDLLFSMPGLPEFTVMFNLFTDKEKVKISLDNFLNNKYNIDEMKYNLLGSFRSYIEKQQIHSEMKSITEKKIKNRL